MVELLSNWELVIPIVGAAIALFCAVARLTPNKTDDNIASGVKSVWSHVLELWAKKKNPTTK